MFRVELNALNEQQQDLEAREAALYCMEGSWGCRLQQAQTVVASGSAPEDAMKTIIDGVTRCIVEELVQADPRLRRHHGILKAVVHSSVGGKPLAQLQSFPSNRECEEAAAIEA